MLLKFVNENRNTISLPLIIGLILIAVLTLSLSWFEFFNLSWQVKIILWLLVMICMFIAGVNSAKKNKSTGG